MKWYNIRIIEADSHEEAMEKISSQEFLEEHPLCDVVLTLSDLMATLEGLPLKVLR